MNPIKHLKRLLKSLNKRIVRPIHQFLKPIIRRITNDPYEIYLASNKNFDYSDFALVDNVISYEHCNFNSWKVSSIEPGYRNGIESLSNESRQVYIILDTQFHDAFGHWFFESAIWIPKIKNILEAAPSIKIHLKQIKGYKTQILEFFNITSDRLTTNIDQKENVCIFFDPCTALNSLTEHNKFKSMLNDFAREFHTKHQKKSISYLLMPRQKKDNYISNDRRVESSDLESYLMDIPNSCIFNTDISPSFGDQVNTIQNSKYIMVTDGSPFSVNAFIAQNSVVIVLGDSLVPEQRKSIEKINIICEFIERHNAVTYVHNPENIFTRNHIISWIEHGSRTTI